MDKIIQLANKAMNMLEVTELNNKDKTLITDVIHKIRKEALTLTDVVGRSEQLVCCENCTHFDKQEKTCVESCVNWCAYNKAN